MNYLELQAEVASYLHRTDLTAKIPTFIELAEAYLFRELRAKELALSVAGVTTGEYGTLPNDFGSVQRITAVAGNSEYSLDYKAQAYTPTGQTYPTEYALENNKLRIWGASTGQAYTLYYIPEFQNLSASVSTNWLLENAPELYLDAACMRGAKHIRNYAEVDRLKDHIELSLDSVKRFSERRGLPATGSMQIKVRRG